MINTKQLFFPKEKVNSSNHCGCERGEEEIMDEKH